MTIKKEKVMSIYKRYADVSGMKSHKAKSMKFRYFCYLLIFMVNDFHPLNF